MRRVAFMHHLFGAEWTWTIAVNGIFRIQFVHQHRSRLSHGRPGRPEFGISFLIERFTHFTIARRIEQTAFRRMRRHDADIDPKIKNL